MQVSQCLLCDHADFFSDLTVMSSVDFEEAAHKLMKGESLRSFPYPFHIVPRFTIGLVFSATQENALGG